MGNHLSLATSTSTSACPGCSPCGWTLAPVFPTLAVSVKEPDRMCLKHLKWIRVLLLLVEKVILVLY